jgi:hypothetical protein
MPDSQPPLTHHDILGLAEPFARAGHGVDLERSDRAARRLVFRSEAPAERLEVDLANPRRALLRRVLTHASGLEAGIEATGADPAELLKRVMSLPASRAFAEGEGFVVARQLELWPNAGVPFLRSGEAALPGLRLTLQQRMTGWRSDSVALALTPTDGRRPLLPEDVLAVLGWDWARLVRDRSGWTSRLRLRGTTLRRSARAEVALDRAAAHLARVLAGTPAEYHDRHRAARWGVVFRRGIPTLTVIGMISGALGLLFFGDRSASGLWLAMLNYVPVALLALAFTLQELPQFEIPPWPRRSQASGWYG